MHSFNVNCSIASLEKAKQSNQQGCTVDKEGALRLKPSQSF